MLKTILKRSALAVTFLVPTTTFADYPVGYQDHYVVRAGSSQRLEVLNNDTGNFLSVFESNDWTVKGGRTTFDSSDRDIKRRRLIYTAPNNFVGEDEFWYVLIDSQGRKNAAKVKVTVKPSNPGALDPQPDNVTVKKNTSIRIDVLKNDGVLVSAGSKNTGSIVEFNDWSKNGGRIERADTDANTPQLKYTPKPGFVGVDEFWYAMKIGASSIKHATKVTINVKEAHFPGPYPVAKPDDMTVSGTNRGINTVAYYPLDNDIGENLKIVDREGWSKEGGRYYVNSDGRLTYTPPSKFTDGATSFTDKIWYVIEDELGRKNWSVINLLIPAGYRG